MGYYDTLIRSAKWTILTLIDKFFTHAKHIFTIFMANRVWEKKSIV